jgi:hypothetical protein
MHPQLGTRRPRRSYRAQPGAAQSAAALFDDSLHRVHQRHRALRHGRRGIITTGSKRGNRHAPYHHPVFPVDRGQRGPRLHRKARRQRPALADVRRRVTSRLYLSGVKLS